MIEKLKIGISSCLLGSAVRYDGGHKRDQVLLDTLGLSVEWVPICPEVGAGLPVPREPMQLVGTLPLPRLVTITTRIDHTEQLKRWVEQALATLGEQHLCGFVFKARSPSCAVRDAEVVGQDGRPIGRGAGLFAVAVIRRFPGLPVEAEGELQDPDNRRRFLERAAAYRKIDARIL